jgi:hypothetical protein
MDATLSHHGGSIEGELTMSMSRPSNKSYYDKDVYADKRNQYRPMEVIVVNTGPYPIEWETRNRHTVGVHRSYSIPPGGTLEEFADFIVLKFGNFTLETGSKEWAAMMRQVSQKNKGGCIPFVEIWSKNNKGRKDKKFWDGKEQFKLWLNSKAGQRYLLGGRKVPIPERIRKMNRKELIELSIKAHFPLDCIEDDTKKWPNIRIARVLATKCSPEYLEDVLDMSFEDYDEDVEPEDEGEDDVATLAESGTKGSRQGK